MNKLKPENRETIMRLAKELALLECFVNQIHFDLEYCSVIGGRDRKRLTQIETELEKLHDDAISRALSLSGGDSYAVFQACFPDPLKLTDEIEKQRNLIEQKYQGEFFAEQ